MENKKPKIALVHDYIKEYGGAENVLEVLSEIFPDAQIYTSIYCPKYLGPHRNRLEEKWKNRINQSFFRFIPFAYKIISPLRLLSPLAFKSFDFSGFDLIITSATGAYFPNSLNKRNAKLICYCHTPPRYLYNLPTSRNLKKYPLINFFAQIANHFLRLFDFSFAQNVDQFIANSQTTAARIQKFYRREAIAINPPIDIPKIKNLPSKIHNPKSFYLTGGRFAAAKRYDIAIKACNELKIPLKIFGRDFAGIGSELKNVAGSTIEFIGEIDNQQKNKLFSRAEAFFFCADNEDFGMVPVEAMACGCPVIAYRSGGTIETIINGKTGVFFNELNIKSCIEAIKRFEKLKINPKDCIARAKDFSKEKFIEKIKRIIIL